MIPPNGLMRISGIRVHDLHKENGVDQLEANRDRLEHVVKVLMTDVFVSLVLPARWPFALGYDGTDFCQSAGSVCSPRRRTTVGRQKSQGATRRRIARPASTGRDRPPPSPRPTPAAGPTRGPRARAGRPLLHGLGAPPEVFVKALNATLPRDVRGSGGPGRCPQSFHATLDASDQALSLRDRQRPRRRPVPTPLQPTTSSSRSTCRRDEPRGGKRWSGRHDFHSFETNWPNRTSSVRTITRINRREPAGRLPSSVEVEADGFLYNMVRSITGTLVLVGLGRRPEGWVAEALAAEDRAAAGPTAPPQGSSSSGSTTAPGRTWTAERDGLPSRRFLDMTLTSMVD